MAALKQIALFSVILACGANLIMVTAWIAEKEVEKKIENRYYTSYLCNNENIETTDELSQEVH